MTCVADELPGDGDVSDSLWRRERLIHDDRGPVGHDQFLEESEEHEPQAHRQHERVWAQRLGPVTLLVEVVAWPLDRSCSSLSRRRRPLPACRPKSWERQVAPNLLAPWTRCSTTSDSSLGASGHRARQAGEHRQNQNVIDAFHAEASQSHLPVTPHRS